MAAPIQIGCHAMAATIIVMANQGASNVGAEEGKMRRGKDEAFEAFDQGQRPSQVNIRGIKRQTLYRYFQQWKKGGRDVPAGAGDGVQAVPRALVSQRTVASGASDTRSRFLAFQAKQRLEADKERLRERIGDWVRTLEEAAKEHQKTEVAVVNWDERIDSLTGQLRDFALAELDKVGSKEKLHELVEVVEGIERDASDLLKKLHNKVKQLERLRQKQAMQRSEQFIRENLREMFAPEFVRQELERIVVVSNESQALTLKKAVSEIQICALSIEPAERTEMWKTWLDVIRQGDWEFIKGLAWQNDERERLWHQNLQSSGFLIGPGAQRWT